MTKNEFCNVDLTAQKDIKILEETTLTGNQNRNEMLKKRLTWCYKDNG